MHYIENQNIIAILRNDYLNEKFSTDWKADLGMLPFGMN